MVKYYQAEHWQQISMIFFFYQNTTIFIQENAFDCVVCNSSSILFRLQCARYIIYDAFPIQDFLVSSCDWWIRWLKQKCRHFEEIFMTCCTEICNFHNTWCSQIFLICAKRVEHYIHVNMQSNFGGFRGFYIVIVWGIRLTSISCVYTAPSRILTSGLIVSYLSYLAVQLKQLCRLNKPGAF